jgi:hypothetical protein
MRVIYLPRVKPESELGSQEITHNIGYWLFCRVSELDIALGLGLGLGFQCCFFIFHCPHAL